MIHSRGWGWHPGGSRSKVVTDSRLALLLSGEQGRRWRSQFPETTASIEDYLAFPNCDSAIRNWFLGRCYRWLRQFPLTPDPVTKVQYVALSSALPIDSHRGFRRGFGQTPSEQHYFDSKLVAQACLSCCVLFGVPICFHGWTYN